MKFSTLVPVCLISTLVGLILPKLIPSPTHLTLACVGYLLVLLAVDALLRRIDRPQAKIKP